MILAAKHQNRVAQYVHDFVQSPRTRIPILLRWTPADTKEMKKQLLQLCVHSTIMCPKHLILRIHHIKCVPDQTRIIFSAEEHPDEDKVRHQDLGVCKEILQKHPNVRPGKPQRQERTNVKFLEVLCDASIPLLREDRRLLDPRVSSSLHVPNHGLSTAVAAVTVWPMLRHAFIVEHAFIVVLLAGSAARNDALTRSVRMMSTGIGR